MASDELIEAHLRALDADPAGPSVAERVRALAREGATAVAAQRARAAVDGGASRGEIYASLARGMWEGGGAERALAVLAFLDPRERRRSDASGLKLQILLSLGRDAEARREAERRLLDEPGDASARACLTGLVPPPERHDRPCALVTLARAERLAAAGEWARAERVLRELRVARPGDREVMMAWQTLQERVRAVGAAGRADDARGGCS